MNVNPDNFYYFKLFVKIFLVFKITINFNKSQNYRLCYNYLNLN